MSDEPLQESVDSKLEETKKILSKVSVQAQPRVLIEINRLARSEEVSFEAIAELVEQDVGLSAKLLKLASSPIYSRGQTFSSVHEALMTIGFTEFRSCFTSVTLGDLLGRVGYPYQGFWNHSRRIALYAREIAIRLDRKRADNAYTLGLFHDVGAVLIPLYHRAYIEHIHRALPLFFGITELEFKLVKTNHCAVGELFGKNWGLADDILQALRYHHRPEFDPSWTEDARSLKGILQLAELINDKIETGDERLAPFSDSIATLENICDLFDLSNEDLGSFEEELRHFKESKLNT